MSYTRNKNWQKARAYFNAKPDEVLHHKDPSLKYRDLKRYEEWNVEDLVVMKRSEHQSYHMKINNPKSGGNKGEDNPMYGKIHSEESKRKMSKARLGIRTKGSKGMHWYNNGQDNVLAYECPNGYIKGRLVIKETLK